MIETIRSVDVVLCHIIRSRGFADATVFYTPPESNLQVGDVVHRQGHEILRHVHAPVARRPMPKAEVLLVRRGRCEIDVYDRSRQLVATRELLGGDIAVLLDGGHGFRMLEDTILFEVKEGPYLGAGDKEPF
jgi:hypothetical protein